MNPYPKIKSVQPQASQMLLVVFDNGTVKQYDCRKLFENEAFKRLKEEWFFKTVQVDAGGYGVSWDEDVDLSEGELWENGDIVIDGKMEKKIFSAV